MKNKEKKPELVVVAIHNCDGSTLELLEPKNSDLARQCEELKKTSNVRANR